MNRDRQAIRLVEQATELTHDQRAEFLDRECAGDSDLRGYVDSLLSNLEQTGDFLEHASTEAKRELGQSLLRGEPLRPDALLCNRYRVARRIGSGGMGHVYLAVDERLDRDVAIKVLNHAMMLDAAMRRRFEREVKSVAGLSHPNIVTLYDIAEHDRVPLAVMEYVPGQTLRECADLGLSLRDALRIARDIAAGLDAAHQRGVMHRDIKPENVMVTSAGAAKVLDFGLARQEAIVDSQSLTDTHQMPGTPPYMSPEQVLAREIGCRTDVFSLGTVLFETLAGKNPFRSASAMETMQRISQHAAPSLADFTDTAPEGLVALVATMLDQRSDRRPTARAVHDRLNDLLSESNLDLRVGDAAERHQSTLEPQHSVAPPAVEPPTNLPLLSVKLTGRDAELAEVAQRLGASRIVTVLGTGGVGKSSLAYEAARRSRSRFPGGVWLCELASLRNQDGVLEALAGVLDGNAGAVNKLEEVAARLDGEPTLVLLDNCEHVIAAAAELVDRLLRQLPHLTFLITSREALKIAGESVLRLEGLQPVDAVALFVTRTTEQGGIQDDSGCTGLVQQIVQQLEGLPLAIELAAPKLAVMSPSELLEALDNQSTTLRAGRHSRGRQSAIDQTIAWSFDLLEPQEQQTLLALSVFASPFTLEAAVEVSGLGAEAKLHLVRLAEQSVVTREEDRGRSRYRLLEPIRQFCQARIPEDELHSARERHARYFARRAIDKLSLGISGYDELECLHAINVEWPDLRQATAWGREQLVAGVAIAPCVALARTAFFQLRLELFDWLDSAEGVLPDAIANDAGAIASIGWGHWLRGDHEESNRYFTRLAQVPPTLYSQWSMALYHSYIGSFNKSIDHWNRYRQHTEEAGSTCEQRWQRSAMSTAPYLLVRYEDEPADKLLEIAGRQATELDWLNGDAIYYCGRAVQAANRGETSVARQAAVRCIELSQQVGCRYVELATVALFSTLNAGPEGSDSRESLRAALETNRELLETQDQSLLPITARSIVVALSACGAAEAASRASAVVEKLRGTGDNSQFAPEYPNILSRLRSELGDERYEQLREEGRRLTVQDMLEIGAKLLDQ